MQHWGMGAKIRNAIIRISIFLEAVSFKMMAGGAVFHIKAFAVISRSPDATLGHGGKNQKCNNKDKYLLHGALFYCVKKIPEGRLYPQGQNNNLHPVAAEIA